MKKIKIKVVTLFPELIRSYLSDALLSKAQQNDLLQIDVINLRDYSDTKYKSVDDTVFGGSDGMLFKYNPISKALNSIGIEQKGNLGKKIIYLSPQGKLWNSDSAKSALKQEEIVLICGRYAGVDQRIIHQYVDEEISIGDYVLSGGELPALVLIESLSRFIPGVLGDGQSAIEDSFENGLLEAPQFTKTQVENNLQVPAVLVSGDHKRIAVWKKNTSILVTLKKRPELLNKYPESINWEEISLFYSQMSVADKELLGLEDLEGLDLKK